MRGYCGVAMYHPKNTHNWGSLCRTAQILGVDFLTTIGQRFRPVASDTQKSWRHVPVFQYQTFEEFYAHLPFGCRLVGVEMCASAHELKDFQHPDQACYLLGAEDYGLPPAIIQRCHKVVRLAGTRSLNVSVAGSIVLYHRLALAGKAGTEGNT